mmetsp:Transcript_37676/g.104040  ORF Transcript_37676/g.104040 Transcript_37676/m.104040 type:complete len:234 (-) Transcript_37676:515-1216(-)
MYASHNWLSPARATGRKASARRAVPSAAALSHSALMRLASAALTPSSPNCAPCASRNAAPSATRFVPSEQSAKSAASAHTWSAMRCKGPMAAFSSACRTTGRLIVWPGCSASSSEYMSDVLNRGKMSKRTCMEAAGAGGHARSTCRSRRNREARVAVPVGPKRRKRDVCHHKRLVGRAPQGQRSHRISVVATASPPCAAWCRTPHSDGPTAAQWQPRSSPTLSGRSQPWGAAR